VHDINRKALEELEGLGAKKASSPKDIAESAEAVILSPPEHAEVESVTWRPMSMGEVIEPAPAGGRIGDPGF
jgi:3-hydroxyisobutyrate dehydrogenase-like beta-hydroxyacid dehydrogenase